MDWNILRELLVPGASCVLTTHYSIDGDAIGSELALAAFLRQTGAEPRIINQDPVPRIYGFLDEHNEAMVYDGSADAAIREADLAFLLDVSAWSRIGAPAEAIQASRAKRICIDHHTTNSGIAEINMTDSTAAATAELIYDMLGAVGGEITPAIARALFVGIATDTGWFRFPNASARAFEIAACLTSRGAAPAELFSLVHEQLRWERMGLLGAGLSELQSAAGGKIAWMALTREMFERTGADSEDVEGIIDILRTIEGVEIAILFREACDGGAPSIRVSLRSKNETDVSRLAEKFGGGGHIRAAGIRLRGMSLREAIDRILAAAEETVGSNDSR